MSTDSTTMSTEFFKELMSKSSLVDTLHARIKQLEAMKFPLPGKYVLIHLTKDNWHDSEDPEGVYWDVAKLVRGISKEERAALGDSDERKHTYCFGDEEGNNLVPYSWETFGPSQYFGQEVDQWEYLPERKQK